MKTITDLKPQLKKPDRINVYLDGRYYCALDLLTVKSHRLAVGKTVDEEFIIEVQKDGELRSATDTALNFITKSIKTEKQVRDKLLSYGYLEEIVDKVVEKIKDYGYINDEDYSTRFVSTYKGSKGSKLISYELQRKGVDKSIAETAVESIEDEEETCLKIAEKYLKNKEKDAKNIAKCYKYLLSKGFSYEVSKTAVDKFREEE